MQKRWLIKTPIDNTLVNELRSKLKIDPIVSELLLQRGIDSYEKAESFFRPSLEDLHDPFLMKDMQNAVSLINDAIKKGHKILLFGDYDVDGTTAVALLFTYLNKYYPNLEYYIPDRYKEGYGISYIGIDYAYENDFKLIISLDCGIRSVEHISYAKEKGIDFIICDHHNPGDELPDCVVLDPKRSECTYPFKELSGCGVGFKLLQGLIQTNKWDQEFLYENLDLVAISIGADIVSVTGENRILCFHGLKQLNKAPRKAFSELIKLAKREFPVSLTDVVFTIAPRINAAGRLRSGKHSVELMTSSDIDTIRKIANEINDDNIERRQLDQEITAEAFSLIEQDTSYELKKSTVVFKEDWHKGVVGIVASRLIEKHFKPTIVLTESNGKATGSARTVNDFDIHAALIKCEHLLDQFGGHTHAAGMTLPLENVTEFQLLFEKIVQESIEKKDESPEQNVDFELSFGDLFQTGENRLKIPRLKRILDQFEPHGPGNMKPVFVAKNVFSTETKILKEKHLKLKMTQPPHDLIMEGIGFNLEDKIDLVASGVPFDLVFTLESNKWRDRETLQLNIKDIRPSI